MDDDFSAHGDLESNSDEVSQADSASLAVVKREMKMMNVVRTFVFALMITFSTITSEVMYVVVRMKEEHNFAKQFDKFANDLVKGFYHKLEGQLVAAESLSSSMTLNNLGYSWPFVSFPEFETRCAASRKLAGASSITYSPLVVPDNLQHWNVFAVYSDRSGDLESNNTDGYDPHYGHNHGNSSVYFMETGRSLEDGIYEMVEGKAIDHAEDLSNDTIFAPIWQRSPTPAKEIRMYDQFSNPVRAQALQAIYKGNLAGAMTSFLVYDTNTTDYAYYPTPHAALYVPIRDSTDPTSLVVGTLDFQFRWESFFEGIMDDDVQDMVAVVENSCNRGHFHSFLVQGPNVTYLGPGDRRPESEDFDAPEPVNSTYHDFLQVFQTSVFSNTSNLEGGPLPCRFRAIVYATEDMQNYYLTTKPEVYRWISLGVFIMVIGVFLVYDCVVEEKSSRVVESAKRTDALVSTIFPSNVKQRLLENADKKRKEVEQRNRMTYWQASDVRSSVSSDGLPVIHNPKRRLKSLLISGEEGLIESGDVHDTEPIADLFPNASVMFADVAGFTAWSSERDPSQVFKLLETLYRSMDKAARRFKVFKVETIGDCYVAATGLPEQRDDHVEAICRFARTSLLRTNELTKALESTLGPGTSELALRFGIHSGPVTAGVLRGEKARFQLFGDTMNFAARMESTGLKNKIHLSQATAEILIRRNKAHWVLRREEVVYAKGKGELQTYWLHIGASTASNTNSGTSCSDAGSVTTDNSGEFPANTRPGIGLAGEQRESVLVGVIGERKLNRSLDRLVEWNTGTLFSLLKKVVAFRDQHEETLLEQAPPAVQQGNSRSFMGEMASAVPLPGYNEEAVARSLQAEVKIPSAAQNELRMYVAAIASGYRKNAFHNFEHASHVILSATKLMKRMSYADGHDNEDGVTTQDLHHFTYGISSDPLTQFAVVFAALIHDVGHEGVPNGQLAKELPHIAALYDNRSIAEQRSVDVALELLALPKYKNLRDCICGNEAGLLRFRQLLIHCVLATDIFEKDLKAQRNQRWEQAFHSSSSAVATPAQDDMNCKATIVLEHIIQASDVSHTMQHWHIYIKWNERLFKEMYAAYKAGRAEKDPSEGWYKGELWFYDNYVIPLAKKLKECGVFGVSSEEYLTYATQNRTEWAQRGEEICKAMKAQCEAEAASKKKIESVPEGDEEHVYGDTHFQEIDRNLVVEEDGEGEGDGDFSQHSYNEH